MPRWRVAVATRFRFTTSDTDPGALPAHQSYTHPRTGSPRRTARCSRPTARRSRRSATCRTRRTTSWRGHDARQLRVRPDPCGRRLHEWRRDQVGDPGVRGPREQQPGDPALDRIYDSAGTPLQRSLLGKTSEELPTGTAAIRFHSTTQTGTTYTTAANDRLCVEVGTVGTPGPAAGGTQGHRRHITGQTMALARDPGYKTGASIPYRDVRPHDHALNIPRIPVTNNTIQLLRAKIAGSLDIIGRWQEYRARDVFPVEDGGVTEAR